MPPRVSAKTVVSVRRSKARTRVVRESRVRKPVPRPLAEASTRMSPRTDIEVEPFTPAPWLAVKFGLLMRAEAWPPSPAMTSEPLVWTAVIVIEPAAVALALRTRLVPSVMAAIVVPALMPGPETSMPGTRPAVLATVTMFEALTVVAESETLAKASVPMFSASVFTESGVSSMRPPPF